MNVFTSESEDLSSPNSQRIIRMGIPTGSLLERTRTDEFLRKEVGWNITGYEPGLRSYQPQIKDFGIQLVAARPQEIPSYLFDGRLDVGITGDDWVEDRALAGKRVSKLADLEYGDVRIVVAVPQSLTDVESVSDLLKKYANSKLICATEYFNIALNAFLRNKTYYSLYGKTRPTAYLEGLEMTGNPYVIIEKSDGSTEGKPNSGLANIIVDNSVSGTTLQANLLKPIETIMNSTAGFYVNPASLQDGDKATKIEVIRRMLTGAVKARKNDYVAINFPVLKQEVLMNYLRENELYAKEPSVIEGKEWSTTFIEMPKSKWSQLVEDLLKLGIDDIVRLIPAQIITR